MLIAFGLFGAAVGATGYLAIEEIAEGALAVGMRTTADPTPLRAGSPASINSAASLASIAPATETASADPAPNEVAPVGVLASDVGSASAEPAPPTFVRESPAPQRSVTENRLGKGAPAQRPRAAAARAPGAEAIAADAGMQPSTAVVASAAIALEPQVPDRWETMSATLASCARENFLAGVVCAERVRHRYCEGFWGQVAQCRAATRPGASR